MKPTIPNIVFKSLLWLRKYKFDDEAKYLMNQYTLNEDQRRLYQTINDKSIYGTFEGKPEGSHG